MSFTEFPKIARFNREIVVTEKIDGTNAHVFISAPCCGATTATFDSGRVGCQVCAPWIAEVDGLCIAAGSRTRYITPKDDNFGFAKWVQDHAEELVRVLGVGRHYGEWWGSGIQRGYGLPKGEKRFSLFNTSRWQPGTAGCCHVVPELYRGPISLFRIEEELTRLSFYGSVAAPGFMRPEGVVIFHTAGNHLYKATIEKDDQPKSRG